MSDRVIDLSEFQPKNIDWQKIKKAGYKVIPRIGLRGSIKGTARYRKICFDLNYKTYISEIIKAGIPFSAYFFPTPMSDAEADQEAEWIISQLDGLVPDMPVYLDSERVPGGMANDITTAQRTRYLKRITDKLVAAGIPCGIYASTSWLQHQINMEDLQEQVQDNTWVAQYATKCTYDGKYAMWQYSSKAKVDGINGNVDISTITGKFNTDCRKKEEKKEEKPNPIDIAIQIASAEVGYHEGANNKTKYGDELHAIQPRNMDKNAAWCDAFVDWVILQTCKRLGYGAETARKVLCGDFDDYTYNSVALYKKAGRWTQAPRRGDQIFFGGSGHTGIVTSVSGGIVNTIEGNKGDKVTRCSYSKSSPSIIGYGRPKYELIGGTVIPESEVYDMPQIQRGSKGKAVKILQIILGDLEVDGSFGPATQAATLAFQKKHGLEADGVVGPKTWRALFDTLL